MDRKIKYLEMILAIISRMASNSFLIKGWCVTLVAALIALGAKDNNKSFIIVGYYPLLMFWILDSYFLWQERLFRKLYDKVRLLPDDTVIDFSMDTSVFRTDTWIATGFSKTLLLFYGTMVGAILLALYIVNIS